MRTPKRRKDKAAERWAHRPWPEWPEREQKAPARQKNTKRWCAGIPGRHHEYKREIAYAIGTYTSYIEKCRKCGRHGRYL